MDIQFTAHIFKDGETYVAYTPDLDLSSCADTLEGAQQNLLEAVRLFAEEAAKMGTLTQILEEAGYVERGERWERTAYITTQHLTLPLPGTHAQA